MANEIEIAKGFEVFSDMAYYDMWCLRPIGNRKFNETIHFDKYEDASRASHVIASWMDAPSQ